jgi:hypothetical protein
MATVPAPCCWKRVSLFFYTPAGTRGLSTKLLARSHMCTFANMQQRLYHSLALLPLCQYLHPYIFIHVMYVHRVVHL